MVTARQRAACSAFVSLTALVLVELCHQLKPLDQPEQIPNTSLGIFCDAWWGDH